MEPTLADDIYRASVLGPDRNGSRRALSLAISGGVFLALAGVSYRLGTRPAEAPAPRVVATFSLEFTETLPPPPPPAGPVMASAPTPAAGGPVAVPETPRALPEPLLPSPAPQAAGPASGAFGGQSGGVPGGQPGGVVGGRVGGDPSGVLPPQFDAAYLRNPEPDYPTLSRRLREEGRVVLRVLVTEEGAPERLEVRQTSGHTRLDEAALQAVRRWRFAPARRGSDRLAAWVLVPLSFSLDA